MSEFEVLLISIDWESPDKVRAIIPSKKYLKPSSINDNTYEYDIVLYEKVDELYFQFAVKTKHTTYFLENGKWIKLHRIENTDFWINKGKWDKGTKGVYYHKCSSINTPGKIKLGLRDSSENKQYINIDINSNIEDFDFDQLKNDFEGELWSLITSKKSLVSVDKIEFKYGDKTIRFPENKLIINFLTEFDKISKNPKRELSSTKEIRRIEKVIPIAETYRKLSTAGTSTTLPSKAVIENHDIYENQFVCFMLRHIYSIVSQNIKNTSLQIERLNNEIETLNQKIRLLENPDTKVNPKEVEHRILFQEQRVFKILKRWEEISNKLNFNKTLSYKKIQLRINHRHHTLKNSFWCNIDHMQFCLFNFPDNITNYLNEEDTFVFVANYNKTGLVETKSGKSFPSFIMHDVRKVISSEYYVEKKILDKQLLNKAILEKNEWRQLSILNDVEKTKFQSELNNQLQTLSNKIKKLNIQIKNIGEFNDEQLKLQPMLENRLKSVFIKKIKWKNFQSFKPSMTFIQNITYRNTLRYYKMKWSKKTGQKNYYF